MSRRSIRNKVATVARRYTPVPLLLGFLAWAPNSSAQLNFGPVTVGAGLRTSYDHIEPDKGPSTDQFALNDIRLYVSGNVTDYFKVMFNTDYDSITNKLEVLDAVGRLEVAPKFNIWFGRFLPPSDRANLYGPFYANQWGVYTDGIQDGYPFIYQGRDNGVTYWGDFAKKKIKVSVGAFDGPSATGVNHVLGAARVQLDFWDPEDGYYLNGTYYGDKNLLAIGGATQYQDGHTATTVDFLLEKKLPNMGVFTIESEVSIYNRLGGYNANYAKSQGEYGLASYLFPKAIGAGKLSGKIQILGKYAKADFTHGSPIGIYPSYNQKTTEINLNYIIKQFNARVMTFYRDTRFSRGQPDNWQAGIALQLQI